MSETPLGLDDLYTRPDWVRRINAMGPAVGGAERLVPLEVDELVERARASTGLADFGDEDGDWRARLDALVASLESDAALSVVGRLMTRQEILRGLRTRLLLTARRAATPAIAEERVEAPIVVTGPARSGTSILFELLALDPAARGPRGFEVMHPVPFDDHGEDAYSLFGEAEQELWADVQPEFAAIHELRSELPVECITITMPSFSGGHWPTVANVSSWIPDFAASMRFHRAVLQTLQAGQPKRNWVLKTPMYVLMIDLLLDTYPDAQVVLTHRDPLKTAPSGLSTLATSRWLRSDAVDVAGTLSDGMAGMLLEIGKRREAGTLPAQFADLHFTALMQDPVGAIEQAYDRLGRAFQPAHADAIRQYLEAKPRGKHGKHRYSAAQWGLDGQALREQTRPYTDFYGVELETD